LKKNSSGQFALEQSGIRTNVCKVQNRQKARCKKRGRKMKRLGGAQQGCQIFIGSNIPKRKNIPNDHKLGIPKGYKLNQMTVNIPNGHGI
jgi:hypothetical protein